jgi:hypothetical protein
MIGYSIHRCLKIDVLNFEPNTERRLVRNYWKSQWQVVTAGTGFD